MSRDETLLTRYGEMLDMIECMAIANGAEPKQKRNRKMSFEDTMALN